jgi:NitT/TauT family transport system ATP-binding protein
MKDEMQSSAASKHRRNSSFAPIDAEHTLIPGQDLNEFPVSARAQLVLAQRGAPALLQIVGSDAAGQAPAEKPAPRLQLDAVSVKFRARPLPAVEDISLHIAPGEFVALLGPSGCGKSTLLNVFAGFVPPTHGRVLLEGEPLSGPSAKCGVVFQKHSLFPWMTVLENVAFGPRRLGLPNPKKVARDLLETVGLADVANAWPSSLSGGMQQRVGIARALATKPPVLLLDEPFGALDAQTRSLMQEELLSVWDRIRPTVVFVTHDIEEAIFLADRVIVMGSHPGCIAHQLQVPFPRPRVLEVMDEPEFIACRREIADIIRVEARKSFT